MILQVIADMMYVDIGTDVFGCKIKNINDHFFTEKSAANHFIRKRN